MRTDFLDKIGSVQADGVSAPTVTLKPDVGQFWTPRFVRVSMDPNTFPRNNQSPLPQGLSLGTVPCQLYLGNTSVPTTQGSLLDVTGNGFADVSGVISGYTLQYGETISAVWIGVAAGTQCTMEVVGMSSDSPPSFGDSTPLMMGPSFRHEIQEPDVTVNAVPFSFLNPGQNSSVTILDPAASSSGVITYLMELDWVWSSTIANGGGDFVDNGSNVITHDMANVPYPRSINFRSGLNNGALRLSGNGLFWKQTGTAAANSARAIGTAVMWGQGLY